MCVYIYIYKIRQQQSLTAEIMLDEYTYFLFSSYHFLHFIEKQFNDKQPFLKNL